MKTLEYQVSFATPAFLGNAEQQAQWRTPPFKALIRQWWRVVKAPQLCFNVDELWRQEGLLFGTASDKESRRSLVLLRLKHWDGGELSNDKWPKQEMRNIQVGQGQVRADVYLGFGPVLAPSKKQGRPEPMLDRLSIDPQRQTNELTVRFDNKISQEQIEEVRQAIRLAAWFGGIGSRSRNGWGAVMLQGDSVPRLPQAPEDLSSFCQPFKECFAPSRDWPHAIGKDSSGALVWIGRKNGQAFKNWREAVLFLATLRRDIRAAAKRFGRSEDISANQLIAYPVTKANNNRWGNDERIAGSLRLKVVETGQGFVPLAVHLPCAVPTVLFNKLSNSDQRWIKENQIDIWAAVHQDISRLMVRMGAQQ